MYKFNARQFEREIPHKMRYKQYEFYTYRPNADNYADGYDLYEPNSRSNYSGDVMYWLTQEPFNEFNIQDFGASIYDDSGDYGFDAVYVACRDGHTGDLNIDLNRNRKGIWVLYPDGYELLN